MNYTDHTTAVTARLVDMIRTGSHGQWTMPWHTHGTAGLLNTRNAITGNPYNGANTVALFLDALERGFPTADYATFNQYRKAGAQVRKGEHPGDRSARTTGGRSLDRSIRRLVTGCHRLPLSDRCLPARGPRADKIARRPRRGSSCRATDACP